MFQRAFLKIKRIAFQLLSCYYKGLFLKNKMLYIFSCHEKNSKYIKNLDFIMFTVIFLQTE